MNNSRNPRTNRKGNDRNNDRRPQSKPVHVLVGTIQGLLMGKSRGMFVGHNRDQKADGIIPLEALHVDVIESQDHLPRFGENGDMEKMPEKVRLRLLVSYQGANVVVHKWATDEEWSAVEGKAKLKRKEATQVYRIRKLNTKGNLAHVLSNGYGVLADLIAAKVAGELPEDVQDTSKYFWDILTDAGTYTPCNDEIPNLNPEPESKSAAKVVAQDPARNEAFAALEKPELRLAPEPVASEEVYFRLVHVQDSGYLGLPITQGTLDRLVKKPIDWTKVKKFACQKRVGKTGPFENCTELPDGLKPEGEAQFVVPIEKPAHVQRERVALESAVGGTETASAHVAPDPIVDTPTEATPVAKEVVAEPVAPAVTLVEAKAETPAPKVAVVASATAKTKGPDLVYRLHMTSADGRPLNLCSKGGIKFSGTLPELLKLQEAGKLPWPKSVKVFAKTCWMTGTSSGAFEIREASFWPSDELLRPNYEAQIEEPAEVASAS